MLAVTQNIVPSSSTSFRAVPQTLDLEEMAMTEQVDASVLGAFWITEIAKTWGWCSTPYPLSWTWQSGGPSWDSGASGLVAGNTHTSSGSSPPQPSQMPASISRKLQNPDRMFGERDSPPQIVSVPERFQQRLLWTAHANNLQFRAPGQLLLYVGGEGPDALDSKLIETHPELRDSILAFDIKRSTNHHLVNGALYDTLCTLAWSGPNCRTWGTLRCFPRPGDSQSRCWWGQPSTLEADATDPCDSHAI